MEYEKYLVKIVQELYQQKVGGSLLSGSSGKDFIFPIAQMERVE
jgi:hypothetical protein